MEKSLAEAISRMDSEEFYYMMTQGRNMEGDGW